MEKAREHQRDLYMCFNDNKNGFDCVNHYILRVLLRDMGVPDNIDIGKGVRQGCILSPLLFSIYADLIELVERVRRASEKAGLYLNVWEKKVMSTGDIGEVTVDGKDIEVVTKFVFLGALITKDGL